MSEIKSLYAKTTFAHYPTTWRLNQINEIVSQKVTYGIVQPGNHDPNGILLIRGVDYMSGWKDPNTFLRVTPDLHKKYKRSITKSGDVLLSIAGYAGEVSIVPSWISEANITQSTISLNFKVPKDLFG